MTGETKIQNIPPTGLREAVTALWRLRQVPDPENYSKLFGIPEFIWLHDACKQLYPAAFRSDEQSSGMNFALGYALNALGLPGRPPPASRHLALAPGIAATRLHAAFERRQGRRVYLCPLDCAGDLPDLAFGPNRVATFSVAELEELVDQPRLKRIDAASMFDVNRFSAFTWLVIEQAFSYDRTPAERAEPDWFDLSGPLVSVFPIEPHSRRYPLAVENALFAMLLAPWEDWACRTFPSGGNWRPFIVPWVYQIDDDLFVRPSPPPSPASLSWTAPYFDDDEGYIPAKPQRRQCRTSGIDKIGDWVSDSRWDDVMLALKSPLFETPTAHFFVKAFMEDAFDGFLAHIIAIEAALGLEADVRNGGVTRRVKKRLSTLLGSQCEGNVYEDLYKVRCAFVHGREMDAMPADKLVAARRLACKVVNALITAAVTNPTPHSREEYLSAL